VHVDHRQAQRQTEIQQRILAIAGLPSITTATSKLVPPMSR